MNITQRSVKELRAPREGNRIYYDDKISGFGVRVTSGGAVAFVLAYRVAGRLRRMTIGRSPAWSVERASLKAKALRVKVDEGHDPLAEREAERTQPLLSELATEYLSEYAEKHHTSAKSVSNDRQLLENHILPALGKLQVQEVTRRSIERLHSKMTATTPTHANRMLSLLSKMFELSVQWGYCTQNPARGIKRNPEKSYTRWLQKGELGPLLKALAEYRDQQAASAIMLLILTGARSGELLKARWEEFDLDHGTWERPSHHTKQRRMSHVPLNESALRILLQLHAAAHGSEFVFPGRDGKAARVTLRRPWIQVLRAAGMVKVVLKPGKRRLQVAHYLPTVRMHDPRHTFASHLVKAGHSLPAIGKLLGHTLPSTTARYAHLDDQPLRDGANVMGNLFKQLGEGKP